MPRKAIKKYIVGNDEITGQEEYYLNNTNLPKASSVFDYTPEAAKELKKCKDDIIYFAENYFYVNGINGKEVIKLFPKQKKILKTIQTNKKIGLITSRQWGKSTLMTIVAIWTAIFFKDQLIAIVANKQSTATEIFNRVREAFLQMDNWIKGGTVEFNKTFMTLSNGSRIITSATSPDAIRGLTIDVLLLDEFAIIPPKIAEDFWAAVTPTLSTRFNNNKNSKLIVASTPKGVGNKFHDIISKAEQGLNDFAIEKAYWYEFPGRDEAWKKQELTTMSLENFEQEYECRFLNNAGSPFDAEMFDKFKDERRDPINVLENGNYLIWSEPNQDRIYSMGVDTAEGVGEDYSVIQIFDITNPLEIEQVARYSSNIIDTTSWSTKVLEIAKQWYSPIMIIERNGAGTTPCDKIFNEWNYPRFVNFGSKQAGTLRSSRGFQPGIISLGGVKNSAITNMKYYIHDKRVVKLYDETTVEELKTFIRKRSDQGNYKWMAQNGFHDDHVMAMVWGLFSLHRSAIKDYLNVEKSTEEGIPIKISKKWIFNSDKDYSNSLYRTMENNSSLIGVVFMKGHVLHPMDTTERVYSDRMTELLDRNMSFGGISRTQFEEENGDIFRKFARLQGN